MSLMQLIFYELPQRLWLRGLSNPVVTFGGPDLDLGFSFLFRIAFRCTFRIPPRSLRPTQAHLAHQAPSQAHLGSLRPIQALLAYQAPPQAHLGHLGTLGPLGITLSPPRFTQAHLGTLGSLGTSLGPFRFTQAHLGHNQAHLGPLRHTWPTLSTLGSPCRHSLPNLYGLHSSHDLHF